MLNINFWKDHINIDKWVIASYRVHDVSNVQVAADFTIRKHYVCNSKQLLHIYLQSQNSETLVKWHQWLLAFV